MSKNTVLFYSKYVSPMYDITTKEEAREKISRSVSFVNHHASVSQEEAELLMQGQHYGRDYWIVKHRIIAPNISNIVNTGNAKPMDGDLIAKSRARAEALAASGAGQSEVDAVDADLTRLAMNRRAIAAYVDPNAKKEPKKQYRPPANKGKRGSELVPPGEPKAGQEITPSSE